ncbi:MAG: Zn-dependent hydrolase, partial [Betaproteobacteria bacterium]
MKSLRVNGPRLWQSLAELARIGATPKGGVKRLTLTDVDRQGRDQFVAWARAAGLVVRVDAIGNIFCRRAGTDAGAAPVAMGSHLDSQPSGGKYDGAYGVMAGLEVLRSLDDAGIRTRAPLEVVCWTNEEGSRFTPVMMGSGVAAGVFTLEHCLAQRDAEGVRVGDALRAIGYAGDAQPPRLGAYFEAHIEQGPVLEAERTTIGVVQGALGQRWFDAVITGQDAHAGPTPMESRQDALIGASRLILEVNRIARSHPDYARGTVGFLQVKPNSRNVVPGEVRLSVEFRNAKDATLLAMVAELRQRVRAIETECRVAIALEEIVYFPPCAFDAAMVAHVRAAAGALAYSHRDIVSGAGHDAVYIARVAPTAMIFIPCAGGISHNELESA